MNTKKKEDKTQQKIQNAIYKFKFSKDQKRDLKTAFDIFDKDGTGNIDIKDLKVILRALGFEPQEDEIKKLLSSINRTDDDEADKKSFNANTVDWNEFLSIMSAKLSESEEIEHLKIGYADFCDDTLFGDGDQNKFKCITLKSLKEVAKTLGEEISDEELKEMMLEANPSLKVNTENGKTDDDSVYRISEKEFHEFLDKINGN